MIEFENVSKTYPNGTHALHNVSLHINKGDFVFIVGASGAGKSTFLKLIMHEETPSEGKITINGTDVTKLKHRHIPYLRRHMGIVFQDFRLIEKMNVFDNVAFAMRAVGESTATIKKRVPYVLDLVGLKDKMKNKPSELSGGEKQRVSLARALVNNPEIIVADEPTGNVDPELSHEIIELLTQINSMGTTVLVVTHEHDLVREFHQRVITINAGRVVSDSADDYIDPSLLGSELEDDSIPLPKDYTDGEIIDENIESAAYGLTDIEPDSMDIEEYIDVNSYSADAASAEAEEFEIDEYKGAHYAQEDDNYDDNPPQYPDNVVIIPD